MKFRRPKFLVAASVVAWVALVATGFAGLQRYSARSGPLRNPDASAAEWLHRHQKSGRPLVVMAIHARCPCTDASLSEFGDFLARADGRCDALLLRYAPAGATGEWPTDREVRELGGTVVPIVADPDGRTAAELGAFTSGSIVFVDAEGSVRFHGGLTIARGHRGRSPAQDALLRLVAADRAPAHLDHQDLLETAPVYGCELSSVAEQPEVCR